jgi:Leucine-rich repeat (LRR) protein
LFYCFQLKVLDLTECLSLEKIPSCIGQLNALQELDLNGCCKLPLSQIGSKGFHNLRLVDLTEASPTIVNMCIQKQNLNNVKWLCFKKCKIRKLPSNLFYSFQLKVLDLTECLSLEKIPSCIGQLNALQELDLNGCSNLKKTTFIYWPIECTRRA